MFYSQVILAKKGPLAKVWLAAHWGDKKLARPQIFATDISQSCVDIMNPAVPLALRLSGHLLLGVVRIYSRKVKYVLNDCTEAMLKLQMAFSKQQQQQLLASSSSGGEQPAELLTERDGQQQLVANFGEFDRVHVVEGFCLPLPEDNEWILADDGGGGKNGIESGDDADFLKRPDPDSSSGQLLLLPSETTRNDEDEEEEEEEQWAPFDPDNEDEEDEENENENGGGGLPNNSRVSDIELVRAANDSLLSEDPTIRSAILDPDKSDAGGGTPAAATKVAAAAETTPGGGDDFGLPFDPEDSEDEQRDPSGITTPGGDAFGVSGLDDSALRLGEEGGDGGGDGGTPLVVVGADTSGLAMDEETPDSRRPGTTAAETPSRGRRRRRKRRKVVIDNNATEMTNESIRAMLRETDDIVFAMPHPASIWDEDGTGKGYAALVLEERAGGGRRRRRRDLLETTPGMHPKKKNNPRGAAAGGGGGGDVPSLTRPFLSDGDGPPLHPVLAGLWRDNYWKALGEVCPYARRRRNDDEEEDVDDVEAVRRARNDDSEDDESSSRARSNLLSSAGAPEKSGEEAPFRGLDPTEEEEEEMMMDFPAAVDDDEEDEDEEPPDVPVPDFGDDDEEENNANAALKRKRGDDDEEDLLDLGMVNDMVLDDSDDDDDRDDDADDRPAESSASTKWHKHTVRVYQHLRKCLKDPNNAVDDEDEDFSAAPAPDSVRFHDITKHVVSRRNAAGVFFEMLQLKTWDFIELNQDESYGEIFISAGVRFGENAPGH